ncbi:hypothetical protein C9925_01000 [cyanobacterium G8-9]|nr:hypothetical protein C9925_01000 [cyanobacterium G8-9]
MKLTFILIIGSTLFIGCGSRGHHVQIIEKKPQPTIKPIHHKILPRPPKKNIKLKKIEDTNYSDTYMYPEDTAAAKKDPVPTEVLSQSTEVMTKEACISMISQEKFDKYTAMFGSEAASIKRCAMLKAMNK